MNLFTKFYPDFRLANEANIILIDNGDGEIVAYLMRWKNGCIEAINGNKIIRLTLSKIKSGAYKLATILVSDVSPDNTKARKFGDNTKLLTLSECDTPPVEKYFTHYKRLPSLTNTPYTSINGTLDPNFIYGMIMSESFNCIMEGIFDQFNYTDNIKYGEKINDKLPTYVFVGRPSSKEWEEQEFAYQRILSRQLHDYKIDNKNSGNDPFVLKKDDISIFVVSEADAAYAQLVCRERKGEKLPNDEYVILIDLGSSTTDVTVVQGNKVILKDSRTIGGGDLDRCILHCIVENLGIEETDDWNLIRVRKRKEKFFEDGDEAVLRLNGKKILMDEELINQSIETMPVYSDEGKEYSSWKECICSFYRDIKKRINQPNKKPSKILVTGGVSNMPCVLDWASEIFGVEAERSKNTLPSESVGLGLAYIAEKELQIAYFRERLMEKVKELLDKTSSDTFAKCIAYGEGQNLYNQLIKNAIKWRDDTTCYTQIKSLKEFCEQMSFYTGNKQNVFGAKSQDEGLHVGMRFGLEAWFAEVEFRKFLQDMIKSTFLEIFPNAHIQIEVLFNISQAIEDVINAVKGDSLAYYYHIDIVVNILSSNYEYCLPLRAPRYTNETIVEREGFWGIGRKEHTLYSVTDIVKKLQANKDRVINGLSNSDDFNSNDNVEFRKSCARVLDHVKEQISKSIEKFASEITPYHLIADE